MIHHALAPVWPAAARALELPRTLSGAGGPQATGAATDATPGADHRPTTVAITFDDGPHPDGTPAILQILAAHGALATFFVIGEQVQRRPQLARRILDEGHAIALHGHRHRLQLRLTSTELADDLDRGLEAIHQATGATPIRHRPPYGIYSAAGLRAARDRGLRPLLWSAWGKDWRKFTTAARIARRATADLEPGGVILLHDADFYSAKRSHERTELALPSILEVLKSRGIGTVLAV